MSAPRPGARRAGRAAPGRPRSCRWVGSGGDRPDARGGSGQAGRAQPADRPPARRREQRRAVRPVRSAQGITERRGVVVRALDDRLDRRRRRGDGGAAGGGIGRFAALGPDDDGGRALKLTAPALGGAVSTEGGNGGEAGQKTQDGHHKDQGPVAGNFLGQQGGWLPAGRIKVDAHGRSS